MFIKIIILHLINFLKKITLERFKTETFKKLVINIFKVKMNLAPNIMNEVFEIVECPYALRNEIKLKSRKIHSIRYGTETAFFVGRQSLKQFTQ